tara:strand:- start:548 stop:766 length:219 start_codon:yes stop_codon:yes gene_type:complete
MKHYIWKIEGNKPQKTYIDKNKKKKDVNMERLAERNLVSNRKMNPFFKSEDYLYNLSIQDKFLRPIDSNIEK